MALFIGFQGSGKSTLAALLADMGQTDLATVRRESALWFTDSVLFGEATKELVLALAGKTVVEIGEMGKRSTADVEQIKAMLSRQVDEGRTAYARAVTQRPRRNIFIGTSNPDQPLSDPTGNRRFLPVRVDQAIDLEWVSENLGQLFAEAAALEAKGETFALPPEVWGDAAAHQEAARSRSDIETKFDDWFGATDLQGPVSYIMASDLADLILAYRLPPNNAARGSAMKNLGFADLTIPFAGKKQRAWVRASTDIRPVDVVRLGTRFAIDKTAAGGPQVRLQGAPQRAPDG